MGCCDRGHGGDEVRQDQRGGTHEGQRPQRYGDRVADAEVVREAQPRHATEENRRRYPDRECHSNEHRRLPGHGRRDLSTGEAERLEDGEIASAGPDRRNEEVHEHADAQRGEEPAEREGRRADLLVALYVAGALRTERARDIGHAAIDCRDGHALAQVGEEKRR